MFQFYLFTYHTFYLYYTHTSQHRNFCTIATSGSWTKKTRIFSRVLLLFSVLVMFLIYFSFYMLFFISIRRFLTAYFINSNKVYMRMHFLLVNIWIYLTNFYVWMTTAKSVWFVKLELEKNSYVYFTMVLFDAMQFFFISYHFWCIALLSRVTCMCLCFFCFVSDFVIHWLNVTIVCWCRIFNLFFRRIILTLLFVSAVKLVRKSLYFKL